MQVGQSVRSKIVTGVGSRLGGGVITNLYSTSIRKKKLWNIRMEIEKGYKLEIIITANLARRRKNILIASWLMYY